MLKVLITGSGQLAWELVQTAPPGIEPVMVSLPEMDITQKDSCEAALLKHKPDWVINAAAYTAVDRAESEREAAFTVNEQGVLNLSQACHQSGARLLHLSTDFVFNGKSNRPYTPEDKPDPLSVYGASKLAGEWVLENYHHDAVIVRTAWLYSRNGNNFVKTMLRLMAEKPELAVVDDQLGTPTWGKSLALTLWAGVLKGVPGGVYHWSDAGVASWYDFAVAIQDIGLLLGFLDTAIPVYPIGSEEFPQAAPRPRYSVLDKSLTEAVFVVEPQHWRRQLRQMLMQLP